MNDIKVPGALWVVLIALAVVFCESYLPAEYQVYGQVAVVAILAVAKAMNLGTQDIEKLIALIREIQNRGSGMRSTQETGTEGVHTLYTPPAPLVRTEELEPNKVVRFLLG